MTISIELVGGPYDGQVHQFASYQPVVRFAGLADENDVAWLATPTPDKPEPRALVFIEYVPTGRRGRATGHRLYAYVKPR